MFKVFVASSLTSELLYTIITFLYIISLINDIYNKKVEFESLINLMETFVLVSATLAILMFTYFTTLTDSKIKNRISKNGELFLISTIQFIIGLFIFTYSRWFIPNINPLDFNSLLNNWTMIPPYIFFYIIEVAAIYEICQALLKFYRGIIDIYILFKTKMDESIIFGIKFKDGKN